MSAHGNCQSKCQQCLLPGAVPGANLDAQSVCQLCTTDTTQSKAEAEHRRLDYKRDLEATLENIRGQGEYDCLVNLSGGKDSCLLLHKLKKEYGLNVLAFTTDMNIPDVAWKNINRTIELLDVPLVTFRPPVEFYKKMFRFLLANQESRGAVRTVCYICAPLFESYSIRLAVQKNIPLIAAGYAPGQPEPDRMEYEFSRKLLCEQDWTPPELVESGLFSEQELSLFWNPLSYPEGTQFPRYVAPFHAWDYSQDEAMDLVVKLGLIKNKKSASPIHSNCPVNWLLMYSDLKHLGFNPYAPEFAKLVREGKAQRRYWRIMGPIVDTMIRQKVMLGRNVSKSLQWLGMDEKELAITRESQGAEYSEQITRSAQPQVIGWDQVSEKRQVEPKTTSKEDPNTTVALLRHKLRNAPDAVAIGHRVDDEWVTLSWRQYTARTLKLAAELQELGVNKGDCVAVYGKSDAGWSITESAIHAIGGTVVGIDVNASTEACRDILDRTSTTTMVVVGDCPDEIQSLTTITRLRINPAGHFTSANATQVPTWNEMPEVNGDDIATIIFTSGTTGNPKGLSYSHKQIMVAVEEMNREFTLVEPGDTTLCWLPMSHLFQRMMNLVAMRQDAQIYFEPEPKLVVKAAGEVSPSVMFAVPRFLEKLAEGLDAFIQRQPAPLRSLIEKAMAATDETDSVIKRRIRGMVANKAQQLLGGKLKYFVSGSAPLSADVAKKLERMGWEILEAYGVSENVVPMSANRPGQSKLGTVGKPLPSNEIRIDADGEIKVRGPGCIETYFGEHDRLLDDDGFLSTGDMGYFDDEGNLVIDGRKDSRLKTSTGRKIFPEQVERVYQQSRMISDMMVTGHGKKFIVALIVPSEEFIDQCLNLMPVDATREEALRSEAARLLMQEELSTLEHELESHERVADFQLLDREFSAEEGELTASLKKRRREIERNHSGALSGMFAGQSNATVAGSHA